ncbi:MAG: ATP-binding protein [Anaerolineae bacterium]|nr:ATP-binding protein [Anaerolineae bacterium]
MNARWTLHQTLPAALDTLDDIAAIVLKAADRVGLSRQAAYRLRLAVDEIATNIVTHGYAEHALDGVIDVLAEGDDDELVITLEDDAPAYTPDLTATPESLDAPLEAREVGGLGLYLATLNVDEFRYDRIDNRNRHTFVVRRADSEKED